MVTSNSALRTAVDVIVIKERIQYTLQQQARLEADLRKFKRSRGYCGGERTCMVFTGDKHTCKTCLDHYYHPHYRKRVTEYGKIRAREKAEERRKKHEAAEEKKRTKKRKAA